MINILSYVGMNMQSEVCLWTLLGLVRTIFDATLFKVNANLKQVWQMAMPEEMSMPVQRVLRTMISGVMLVQCFTVYIYLASYTVLLYPVFLEERPNLVLPWLLLAAIRKLLCELMSLALGLGTCVLLGPARPPCIKFLIVKVASIMPAFYMWMLVFSYYQVLKVASAFKTFSAVLPTNDHDYGLELAVRRRRTKSLLGEEQLRRKLVTNFYGDRPSNAGYSSSKIERSHIVHSTDANIEDIKADADILNPISVTSKRLSDTGSNEQWFGAEVVLPRDTDRILEQFVLMLLRISIYLTEEGSEYFKSQCYRSQSPTMLLKRTNLDCANLPEDDTDTPMIVGSSKGSTGSYLHEYPQIFMKKSSDIPLSERKIGSIRTVNSQIEREEGINTIKSRKRVVSVTSNEKISLEIEKVISHKKSIASDKNILRGKSQSKQSSSRQTKYRQNSKDKPRHSHVKETALKQEPKENQRATTSNIITSASVDRIKSIIEKVKNHISETKKSFKEDEIKYKADGASSSHVTDQPQISSRSSKSHLSNKSGSDKKS